MLKVQIRTSRKEGETPLFIRLRIAGKSEWLNLYLNVDVQKWNDVKDSDRKMQNYLDRLGYSKFIFDIEFGIKGLKQDGKESKENVDILIRDIVLKDQREKLLKQREVGERIEKLKRNSVKRYITDYVDGMISGEERNAKGEHFSTGTIKAWKTFRNVFLGCYDQQPFTWEEIDQRLINRFIDYMEKGGYMKNCINKYLKSFKQLISDSEKIGLHKNSLAKTLITRVSVKDSDTTKKIYLTKEELDSLYNTELDGFEDLVRDFFLIGCYTAQRYSDYFITEDSIGQTSKGVRVIRMQQQKTKNMVVIPIMDSRLETLLKKYNYNIPKVADQNINRTIKKIGERLSKSVPSLAVKEITKLTKQERTAELEGKVSFERNARGEVIKPRYQLIMTHTARRSGITNMYLSGKYSVQQIMAVSGHKDDRTFRDYVKLSLDEKAEEIFKLSSDGMF